MTEELKKAADSHRLLFGDITREQGRDISFLPLRSRVPKDLKLTIASIDQAQGLEADVEITCTTRANSAGDMGFVNEPERWNVNISRAKSMLLITGNVSRFHCARDAELPPMLRYLVQANCAKKIRFLRNCGMRGIVLDNLTQPDVHDLPVPLTSSHALNDLRTAIIERAAEQARLKRKRDRTIAWEDRQGVAPSADKDTFLQRLTALFREMVEHRARASLDSHLSRCARHCNFTGDVPEDKLDCDLKEISAEGYCQNGMFLDPGNQVLAI